MDIFFLYGINSAMKVFHLHLSKDVRRKIHTLEGPECEHQIKTQTSRNEIFSSRNRSMLFCGAKLEYCHTVSKKTISTLNGTLRIINLCYRCSSETCDHVETVYRSAEADNMSMKYHTYIGQLRYKEHKTRGKICEELFNRNIMTS